MDPGYVLLFLLFLSGVLVGVVIAVHLDPEVRKDLGRAVLMPPLPPRCGYRGRWPIGVPPPPPPTGGSGARRPPRND